MHVRFMPDGRTAAGGGHVSRCLAVAESARQTGLDVDFTLRDAAPSAIRAVEAAGFPDADHAGQHPDWIVIDDYRFDSFAQELRGGAKLMVFDDLGRWNDDCDVLINAAANAGMFAKYDQRLPSTTALLFGPRFAAFRHTFTAARLLPRQISRGERLHIWLFFGSVDRQGMTRIVLEAMADSRLAAICEVHTVVSGTTQGGEAIRRAAAVLPHAHVHDHMFDLPRYLSDIDLGFVAAGVSLWELCCLGIPALAVAVAENQVNLLATVSKSGAVLALAPPASLTRKEITEQLEALIMDSDRRQEMSMRARRLVDGRGMDRIAMTFSDMEVRPVENGDLELLWRWANDHDVRKNAVNQAAIPLSDHISWFSSKRMDPNCRMYLGTIGKHPVGQVRFDLNKEKDKAEIDISVAPEWRGRKRGTELLLRSEALFRRAVPLAQPVARVKRSNASSLAMFNAAGYTEQLAEPDSDLLVLTIPQ